MAFKVLQVIFIASVIAASLSEAPVRIDEQHLRVPESQGSGNGWQDSVPGLPGKDYPNLSSIPKTSFSCAGKTPGGYYADVETRCQVFHVCNTEGTKSSFLCPSGSIFNQRHFVCDWWYDFECERAPDFYSLNEALDEDESTSDQSELDRYSDAPNAPLPYNSIGASNNDLSLASSGYPNNIRDEANLIYEDYTSGKIQLEANGNLIPEKSADSAGAPLLSSSDNYSDGLPRESMELERFNAEQHQLPAEYQRSNSDARSLSYRSRSPPVSDNVPRGFSSGRAEYLKRNDNAPGFFVNNGLFEEREKSRENINLTDNQYSHEFNKIKEKSSTSNHSNIRYGIYYQNPEKYPLPQEKNNNVNNDSREIKESNYYNGKVINSNYQYSYNETYANNNNSEKIESRALTRSKYEKAESSSNGSARDFEGEPYNRISEYGATTSRASSSDPTERTDRTEDEVDREWQRAIDSTELKRNSAHRSSYDYESSGPFLIREESGHPWRSDLTTSSSGPTSPSPTDSEHSHYGSSTLSRPEESTRPTAKERANFLGSRPTAGLLSGAGNGLPGANKVLAGSVGITAGKSSEDTTSTLGPSANEAWDTRRNVDYLSQNQGNKVNEFAGAGPYWNQ